MKPIKPKQQPDYKKANKIIDRGFLSAIGILASLVLHKHFFTPQGCVSPWCMCDAYTDDDGKRHKAKCCHPKSSPCKNPDQDKHCNYLS
jgi:hypothetical protein